MLKQHLQLKLSQKLSPQQIQLMKLIQLPTQAFEQQIKHELEENPALELGRDEIPEDDFSEIYEGEDEGEHINADDINLEDYLGDDEVPDYLTRSQNYADDDEDKQVPYAAGISFTQYLQSQLNTEYLDDQEWTIAEYLIGSIDESGYIRRSIADIVDDLAFTQNLFTDEPTLLGVLKKVQNLDPPGVGARSLEECLALQLARKEATPAILLALEIIRKSFELFSKKHFSKLQQKYNLSDQELRQAITEIEKLNPKPGGSYAGGSKLIEHVVPDFAIRIIEGDLELTLNSRNAPELHVSREYSNMLAGYKNAPEKSRDQKDAVQFIKQKLDAAKWFIDAIKQRQQTLYVTMEAIMNYQKEYFLNGDERSLKPMILKDIADKIRMDVSTVSRVANSKYVDTPYGTKLIKDFFSEAVKNVEGEDVSTREIKKILETVLGDEDKRKPLTDDKLAKILKEKGYPIARRTVAKYREQLGVPVARLRKEL
jgi:RNA polymerase sigma-54 factor